MKNVKDFNSFINENVESTEQRIKNKQKIYTNVLKKLGLSDGDYFSMDILHNDKLCDKIIELIKKGNVVKKNNEVSVNNVILDWCEDDDVTALYCDGIIGCMKNKKSKIIQKMINEI